jgi:hypothetical protein
MNSAVTSPTSAPSARRRIPPATITSTFGLVARMFATLRLLVTTIRLRCLRSACATASVVVPMFMKIDTPSGICAATIRAIAAFSDEARLRRSS